MSNYRNVIIFILVLIIISSIIVFIDSSIEDMNKLMPDISNGIVSGDKEYNNAVELVNNKSYDEAMQNAVSAEDDYNSSLELLSELKNNFSSDMNNVHKDYIQFAFQEVELKIKAVNKLENAIDSFKINSNYTGTNYANEANNYMFESIQYQNSRNSLVSNNSNLFKDNFII